MPIADRLVRNRVIVGECWLWTGWRLPSGYGTMRIRQERRTALVHRVAYEVWIGPIPEGMDVLHSCDTPPCFRPEHLWLGTQHDNAGDMDAKGRRRYPETPNRHLSDADRADIIRRRDEGESRASVAARYSVTEPYVSMLTGPRRHRYQARACE